MLNPAEVDLLVQQLRPIPIEEVGTKAWKDQRDSIEKLNVASHQNANAKKDDYVMSYLIQHDKLSVLLHELLVCEVWRHRVMPKAVDALLQNPTGIYMYCYYESVLVNLIECLGFFEEVITGFGDDVLELVDYCWRNVSALFSMGRTVNDIPAEPALDDEGPTRFWHQINHLHRVVAMGCISILWFVVDRLKSLPLAVTNSILVKNDLPVGIAEVIEMQPWMRMDRSANKYQKFKGGQYADIGAEDRQVVVATEAHAWFILHYLLCDRDTRTKYQYTKSKKELIMRVKKFLHETMIDQLPALMDVQRAVEELSFLEPPTGTEEKFKHTLLIDQVPRLMTSIDGGSKGKDWIKLAERMKERLLSPESRMEDAQRYAALFDELYQPQQ